MLNQLVGCPMSLGRVELAGPLESVYKKNRRHQVSDKSSGSSAAGISCASNPGKERLIRDLGGVPGK